LQTHHCWYIFSHDIFWHLVLQRHTPGADLAEQIRSKGWKAALELLAPELQKRQPVETGQRRVGQMRPKLTLWLFNIAMV
jgi:hypothetical protein